MKFLDSMYIVCCDFYKKREKDLFKTSGVVLLAGVILMNILLASFIIYRINRENLPEDFIDGAALITLGIYLIILLPVLYLRYFRLTNYDELNSKFCRLAPEIRQRYRFFVIFYILLSIVSTLGYTFYSGGAVNGWW